VSSSGAHRVVVVGGGFGGLQAVKALREQPVTVTLIDRRSFHLFQPLVYQVATGMLGSGEIAAPLRSLFKRDPGVHVMLGEVSGFDVARRRVRVNHLPNGAERQEVAYDTLIVGGPQNRLLVLTRWMFSYVTRNGGARLITGAEVAPLAAPPVLAPKEAIHP
jgi:NADH dehydrogenase FAD-containing subunit